MQSEQLPPLDEPVHSAREDGPARAAEARWPHLLNIALGAWLLSSPVTHGYRSAAMVWSDVAGGVLLMLLGAVSLSRRFGSAARWAVCLLGVWLLFAPLVFWASDAAAYGINSLIGALAVVFAVIVPGVPGRSSAPGPDVPPGWSYNPSTWVQRSPIIALAFVSFLISRYLAAYQLDHLGAAWDPFFGAGTVRVLDSEVSHAWPVSDAGLGAVSYMVEVLTGGIGDQRRWRTMPWMVILFGILVAPLGVVSIVLVILQPLAVGAWCTLCLLNAVLMLVMIAPSVDEIVATVQFLGAARRRGKPLWRTFWGGGALEAGEERPELPARPERVSFADVVSATGLGSVPWNLLLSAGLGMWMMAAPPVFGTGGAAAASAQLVGPLVVTFAVIAFGEVTRPVRYLNLLLGAWTLVAPWLLAGAGPLARGHDALIGIVLIILSFPRGRVRERYGDWNRRIV